MAKTTSQQSIDSSSTGLLEPPGERERIFELFRRWGYVEAKLDPLGFLRPQPHPELPTEGEIAQEARRIYCGSIGVEFMHIADPQRRRVDQERMEPRLPRRSISAHSRSPGPRRTLRAGHSVALSRHQALLARRRHRADSAARRDSRRRRRTGGAEQSVLAMSHRGRLNVMVNTVGKPPAEIFAGFEDVDPRSVLGGGDVKYHIGATGDYITANGKTDRASTWSPIPATWKPSIRWPWAAPAPSRTRAGDDGKPSKCCRSSFTATPRSPARASGPRH